MGSEAAAHPGIRSAAGSGLLRVPLFHKILLANSALVFLIAAGSTAVAVEMLHAGSWRAAFGSFLVIAMISAAVTIPVYAVILRFALAPLELLEQTAERVEGGDLGARASLSPLADPRLTRLTTVFNRLLDHVVTDRERLRDVAARAFGAQEAERTRIARELQEETAQTLSLLMLRLRVAKRTPEEERRAQLMDEMRAELAEVAERIRGTARALQPPALTDLGVAAAIEAFARTAAPDGPPIHVVSTDIRGLLTTDGELALYRIVQEAVGNAVRHAGASEIQVSVSRNGEWVVTDVSDDGCGFSEDRLELRQSLGLFGMQERALYAGGSVAVDSAPGEGTRVQIRIPVAELDAGRSAAPDPAPESRLAPVAVPMGQARV